jgi:Glycosyl hydrolase family 26
MHPVRTPAILCAAMSAAFVLAACAASTDGNALDGELPAQPASANPGSGGDGSDGGGAFGQDGGGLGDGALVLADGGSPVPDGAVPDGTLGDGETPPSGTWSSGASGSNVASGEFGTWRGSKVTVGGTWNDGDWSSSEGQPTLSSEYGNWQGDIDDTLGAFWSGSWSQAAAGAYDGNWTTAVKNMAAARAGKSGTFYVRLAHEMNGDWYEWKVNSSNVADFKTAWVRFAGIVRAEFPAAKIVFGANNGTNGDIGVPAMWPGDAYVDVVGVDFYDMWPNLPDQATWDSEYMGTDHGDSPRGIGAWLAFAKSHGKPLSVPEWGLNWANDGSPGPQDNPFFIQKMNDFFRANAGSGPGQILYEVYYNIDDVKAQLYPVASNPNGSAKYKSLSWGK